MWQVDCAREFAGVYVATAIYLLCILADLKNEHLSSRNASGKNFPMYAKYAHFYM